MRPLIGNAPAHDSRVTGGGDRAAVRPVDRIFLVVLGLAASVYGIASLTGAWLGTPPWWKSKSHRDLVAQDRAQETAYRQYLKDYNHAWPSPTPASGVWIDDSLPPGAPVPARWEDFKTPERWTTSHWEGRAWVGWSTAYAGYFLALGAWPRRRRPTTTT